MQGEFQASEEGIRDTALLQACNSSHGQQQKRTAKEACNKLKAWQTVRKRQWMSTGEALDDQDRIAISNMGEESSKCAQRTRVLEVNGAKFPPVDLQMKTSGTENADYWVTPKPHQET